MAQKPKSSGKSTKAAKPASSKTKAETKPKTASKTETNHKVTATGSLKLKPKSDTNGHDDENETPRPQVRLPQDA